MNVSEIRQRIFDQMDYFPDLQQYRDSVVRRMNDRYQELCDSAHWLFLQKEREITIRKEVTGDADSNVGVQITTSTNPRLVTGVNVTFTLEMEGQTLTNTKSTQEFRIIRVTSATTLFIDKDWDGVGLGATENDFKITFQRFLLPEDCIEVLGFIDRDDDRGKLLYVDRRREEFAYLDADNSGDPSTVIEDEHIIDDPPVNKPIAVIQTSSQVNNNLVNGLTYEYKYTIYREGRESPPSLPVQITIPSTGTNEVSLSNIDSTGFFSSTTQSSLKPSGMDKLIYRRDVTNDGKWMLIGSVSSQLTGFVDHELLPIDTTSFQGGFQNTASFRYTSSTEVKRWQDPGPRQYVRFYYTPSEDKNIHIRYHFRPHDLVADNDSPALPRQYHMILVYMTLQEMFLQMQDTVQSQLFERRAELMKIQLRRRFLY